MCVSGSIFRCRSGVRTRTKKRRKEDIFFRKVKKDEPSV